MKYSTFTKRIEERAGFKVENEARYINVIAHGCFVGNVEKECEHNFAVRGGGNLTKDEARYLAQMCHQLACTPLEEREKEKKYWIRHKFLRSGEDYLNYLQKSKVFEFNNIIPFENFQEAFTTKELKELTEPAFYTSLLDKSIYDWEEVAE